MTYKRADGRKPGDIRTIEVRPGVQKHAEGSVLFAMGDTRVVCAATIEERVPPFLRGAGKGWVTAEYSMLPRATNTRVAREGRTGKVQGRTHEIQRLVGRSLRAVVDFEALGERTVTIDCDVLQADGGTRTASINGAWIALWQACRTLVARGAVPRNPVLDHVVAVSVGIVGGRILADLDYSEDSAAEVDMNVVMTGNGRLIEVQGTAEREPFTREQLDAMLSAAAAAGKKILKAQRRFAEGGGAVKLLIASKNRGKVVEIRALLGLALQRVVEVVTLTELPGVEQPRESGKTFAENARIKALHYAKAHKILCLADDSGLAVDSLGGLPGVRSARFAGEGATDAANNAHLLHELAPFARPWKAAFVCVAAAALPQRVVAEATGKVEGEILPEGRGRDGFGYDPLFFVPSLGKTMAELSTEEKNLISHRGHALRALIAEMKIAGLLLA